MTVPRGDSEFPWANAATGALRKLANDKRAGTPHPVVEPGVRFSHEAFAQLLDATFEQARKLSALKGGEYSGDTDRLANFRRNARDCDLLPEQIWRVYAAKHWDAIGQYVRDLASETSRERLEGLEGRCDDLIVYLILFKAMLTEHNLRKETA